MGVCVGGEGVITWFITTSGQRGASPDISGNSENLLSRDDTNKLMHEQLKHETQRKKKIAKNRFQYQH